MGKLFRHLAGGQLFATVWERRASSSWKKRGVQGKLLSRYSPAVSFGALSGSAT
jgi:hypothetical protein